MVEAVSSNNISEDFEFSITARGEYVTYIVRMLRVILSYRAFQVDVGNENFDTHRIIDNNAFQKHNIVESVLYEMMYGN